MFIISFYIREQMEMGSHSIRCEPTTLETSGIKHLFTFVLFSNFRARSTILGLFSSLTSCSLPIVVVNLLSAFVGGRGFRK